MSTPITDANQLTDADRAMQAEYKVNLDMYSGPLELLLFLIKREEVDIQDIPIARITEQYLQHVNVIRKIDINLAGEFLVMAATLMEIKSRMLLPKPVETVDPNAEGGGGSASVEDFADPRAELVRQLLAYKQFKDAAEMLRRKGQEEASRFPRGGAVAGDCAVEIEDLSLFSLIDAFNAIMASVGHSAFGHEVVYDDTPLSLHQADILDRLTRDGPLTLKDLFVGRTKKTELIGLFLATLELIRQKKITVEQDEAFGDVRIILREHNEDVVLFGDAPAAESPAESGRERPDAIADGAAEPGES